MGELTFLSPWLLGGAALASLPVIIHLIGRRRAPVVRFAAFDFLMAVNKRLAKRERLRQILLLILRTLAVLALVAAVARPMPKRAASAGATSKRIAIVFDASGSMRYVHDGRTLFESAKRRVRDLLSHTAPGDAATLIVAGREVTSSFQAPTLDLTQVRNAVDKIENPEGVANIGAAIDMALSQLGGDGSNAVLVIVSDLSENSFANLRPTAMDPPPEVRLVDAAERDRPEALANIAIESVLVEGAGEQASERRINVTVRNYGVELARDVPIELKVAGEVTQRGRVDIPAFGSIDKTLTYAFAGTGVFRCEVRLSSAEASPYPFDDALAFVVDVAPGVHVLAIDGDPRTTPYDDELFFFEHALQAVPKGDPPIDLRILGRDEIGGDFSFDGFDVIVLANVGELPGDVVKRLNTFVAGGGGLLFTLGSEVKFERYNTLFADLLPHPLRDLHKAADEVAGTPPLGIGDMDWDHPVLASLGQAAQDSLRASRTRSYFNLDVGSRAKAVTVLRFDNGAPALVERRDATRGRVMMLATSIDVDMSDIALRSAFPALVQRTVRYLSKSIGAASLAPARVGGIVEMPVPTGADALALVSPSGVRLEKSSEEGARRRLNLGPLTETGFYTAFVQSKDWLPVPRLDVAVNASLDESSFRPVQPSRISEALGGGAGERVVSVTIGTGEHDDPFAQRGYASYLLLTLCLVFIGESFFASRG